MKKQGRNCCRKQKPTIFDDFQRGMYVATADICIYKSRYVLVFGSSTDFLHTKLDDLFETWIFRGVVFNV